MSALSLLNTCYSNNTIVSRELSSKTVTTTQQESPESQTLTLTANGQTIPTETPVVTLLTALADYDDLVLAPPSNTFLHARFAIINASGKSGTFDTTPSTSKVANSNLKNTFGNNTTSQFVWNPNTSLWYALEPLDP